MKSYTISTNDSSGNLVVTNKKYSNTGNLQAIYTDVYDSNKILISNESIILYDNSSQIHIQIIKNYKEKYTKTKAYYETGQLKGVSDTVDNIYVIHKKYNEDGTIKKEWITELPHSTLK